MAALIAVLPLVFHGCSCGHDFDFHIVSWIEAASKFRHGDMRPLWTSSPAFNAGEPRFVFYPPLSWTIGGLLGLAFTHIPGLSADVGWNLVPIAFTWIALILGGIILYRFASRYASPRAALFAAILYLANPYLLFTAYERTAYGELLAAAWMPLLLDSVLKTELSVGNIALPVALLWLTNAPAAVIGCYTLAFLGIYRVISTGLHARRRATDARVTFAPLIARLCFGVLLGLSLAAVYLLPAVYERRWVQVAMATIADMRIDHNFLFEHTGKSADAIAHDQVLHTASVISVVLLGATFIALGLRWYQKRSIATQHEKQPQKADLPLAPIAALMGLILLMLMPLSEPFWRLVPELSFLQFPWRLLAVLTPMLAVGLAVCLDSWTALAAQVTSHRWMRFGLFLSILGIVIGLIFQSYRNFHQPCGVNDLPASWSANLQKQVGTYPTDEYTPSDADNDALKAKNPPYWLSPSLNGGPDEEASMRRPGPAPRRLTLRLQQGSYLILNLRRYPLWQVNLNGTRTATEGGRDDGLISIPLRAGTSTIEVREIIPVDVRAGEALSLVAFAIWLWIWLGGRGRRRSGVRY